MTPVEELTLVRKIEVATELSTVRLYYMGWSAVLNIPFPIVPVGQLVVAPLPSQCRFCKGR